MPFDNTPVETEVAHRREIAILDGMAERLASPGQWCKKRLFKRKFWGGYRFCLMGALNDVDHGDAYYLGRNMDRWFSPAAVRVWKRMEDHLDPGHKRSVVDFNNDPRTTHADVVGLLRRTRASFE